MLTSFGLHVACFEEYGGVWHHSERLLLEFGASKLDLVASLIPKTRLPGEVLQALCACGRLERALQLLTPERLRLGLNGQPLMLALIRAERVEEALEWAQRGLQVPRCGAGSLAQLRALAQKT